MNARSPRAIFLLLAMLFVGTTTLGADPESPVADIGPMSARDYVASHGDAVILDVRTPIEYEMSHITGAVNVDVQNDSFWDMAAKLDPDKTYIVHCTKNPAGGRSSRALTTLQSMGFKNLYSLEGGYIGWQEAGLPLTENSSQP